MLKFCKVVEPFGCLVLGDAHAPGHECGDQRRDGCRELVGHSLGWVVARDGDALVGFVNVVSDGLVHAWIQDTMVATAARHRRIATELVARAVEESRAAGCEWLHVDFEDHLRPFYLEACGFEPTNAGLIHL